MVLSLRGDSTLSPLNDITSAGLAVREFAVGVGCRPSQSADASSRYCLSYTAVLVTLLPFALVPFVVTVRVLPLAETTMRPVRVTLPPCLAVNANVWLFIFLYDRLSEVGSPLTA